MARVLVIVAAVMFGLAVPCHAYARDPLRAEEAFQKGRAALAEGRYAEACKSFQESQDEDPASGTLLALAYCQELSGMLATAYANYRAAAELAQREGHDERRVAAADQSKALAERVSVLTILVPPTLAELPELKIKLDGVEIGRAKFGAPIPVDGGTYRVEATVGRVTWSEEVSVQGERDKKTLVVELSVPPPGEKPAAPPTRKRRARPVATDDANDSRVLEITGLGAMIGGAATLTTGIVFGLVANGKNQASLRDGHCDASGCDARGYELRDDAFTAAHVSTWCIVAGSVFAAGGAGLYFGAKASSSDPSPRVEAGLGPTGVRLSVTEAF